MRAIYKVDEYVVFCWFKEELNWCVDFRSVIVKSLDYIFVFQCKNKFYVGICRITGEGVL